MPVMYLAGLPIPASDVLELARLVDDPELAGRLEIAYGRGARILALEIDERLSILRALEDGASTTPSPSFAVSCLPNTPAASATGWRKLSRDPDLIGGATCTQSS